MSRSSLARWLAVAAENGVGKGISTQRERRGNKEEEERERDSKFKFQRSAEATYREVDQRRWPAGRDALQPPDR